MWQQLIVAVFVLAAAAYAVWALLPAATRWRLRIRLAAALARAPAPLAALGRRALWTGEPPAADGCASCPASAPPKAPPSQR